MACEDGRIVARGHNCRVQHGDPTSHGETECIRSAGRRRDWRKLTLVTILSPCPMCAGTAVLLGLRRVVIGERRSYRGAEDWLHQAGIAVECLDDPACMALMERMQRRMGVLQGRRGRRFARAEAIASPCPIDTFSSIMRPAPPTLHSLLRDRAPPDC